MSVDLLQQLRDYGTWHEDTQHHVVAGDVIDATRPIPPLQPARRTPVWRGVGVAVAVGFVFLALMAHPVSQTCQADGVAVSRHGQVQIRSVKLGLDLCIESVVDFL